MSDFYARLKAELPDEIESISMYSGMAHTAHEHGKHACAQMLHDMACEERDHAQHIMQMLDAGGVAYDEYVEAYEQAVAALHS